MPVEFRAVGEIGFVISGEEALQIAEKLVSQIEGLDSGTAQTLAEDGLGEVLREYPHLGAIPSDPEWRVRLEYIGNAFDRDAEAWIVAADKTQPKERTIGNRSYDIIPAFLPIQEAYVKMVELAVSWGILESHDDPQRDEKVGFITGLSVG